MNEFARVKTFEISCQKKKKLLRFDQNQIFRNENDLMNPTSMTCDFHNK